MTALNLNFAILSNWFYKNHGLNADNVDNKAKG